MEAFDPYDVLALPPGAGRKAVEVSYATADGTAASGADYEPVATPTVLRFEPGETRTVQLVEIAGRRIIRGGNALATGPVSEEGRKKALEAVKARGFAHQDEEV